MVILKTTLNQLKLLQMDFRALIKKSFGVDIPIKNGFGSSYETAVVMELVLPHNEYIHTQYVYIKYLAILRDIKWKMISQELVFKEGKTFDIMKIETKEKVGKKILTFMETHYFDITECWEYEAAIKIEV